MLSFKGREQTGLFYGWVVVGAVFVVSTVTSGLGFYNASVILRQAREELDVSVSAVSAATAVFFAVSGVLGFTLSRLMDRVDLRLFYVAGAVLGAVAFTGLRYVDSVFDLYVFFIVLGAAFAFAGLVPSITIVTRWFDRRRSVAISIAATGLSFGGIALTPFVARFIEDRSLGGAGPWLGLAWLIGIAPISILLIRSWPSDMGLEPDGTRASTGPTRTVGATFSEAMSTRFYKYLNLAYALIFAAQVGAIAQLFNLVSERIDSTFAATSLSVMAFASVIGRLTGGVVVARVSTKSLAVALTGLQAVAFVLIAGADSRASILFGSVVFGISIGNLLMLQPLLIAETFGVKSYPRIYSFAQLMGTIGMAAGPFMIGFLRDVYDYEIAMYVAATASAAGMFAMMAAGSSSLARAEWEIEQQ